MASRDGAVFVATTRRMYKGKTYESPLLRRSYREGGKVLHETVGNLSHLPAETIDLIRRSLRGEHFVAAQDHLEIVRSLPHGHVAAVLGALRATGLDTLLDRAASRERDLAIAMIAARVLDPRSKLATTRAWTQSTLADECGVGDADEDALYAAMDWLQGRQPHIENGLARRHLGEGALVLYDLTSTYFEGHGCPLAQLGYSRDGKRGLAQIVFGLLTDAQGCPLAVEVFAGNTGDPSTVARLAAVVRSYQSLSQVERAFRSLKTLDLHVRPIHHYTEARVQAHVFLCMLAFSVQWHMQRAWAPMLFADEVPPGRTGRSPAQRFARAEDKAHTQQRPGGQRVHSFRSLLAELATLTRNRVRPVGADDTAAFDLTTIPTPLQREALERLGITGRV